jgi:hypothetical protein
VFTKKLFWVLVIGSLNLASVDAKERSFIAKNNQKPRYQNGLKICLTKQDHPKNHTSK